MRYLLLFMLFLTACNNSEINKSKKVRNSELITLSAPDQMDIDSVLSVAVRDRCIYIGPTGLAGNYTEEFKAYETVDKVMTNEKLYALLKNKNPKVRFLAMNILHDRPKQKLFKEGILLLKNDTSVVCYASGCSTIELPLNMHIKFLAKQRN